MTTDFNTEAMPIRNRTDFWRQVLRDRLKIDCHIETDSAANFRQDLSLRQFGDLSIMELESSPFRVARRAREEGCLTTVMIPQTDSSAGALKTTKGEIHFGPGELCVYHSCRFVSLSLPDAGRHLIVTLPSIFLADRCPEWNCDTLLIHSATEGIGGMFADLVRSLATHDKCLPASCRNDALSLVLALLTSAAEVRQGRGGQTMGCLNAYHKERIRNFALSHLRDPDLNIQSIATGVDLSPRHIHHLFSDEPLHLMQWIYEQRLLRCHRELMDRDSNNRSIGEIAYAWGFNSPAHFCRVFQKRFAATPSKTREQARSTPPSTLG